MKYACLIYSEEQADADFDPSSPEFAEVFASYMAFGEAAGERILAGEALESVSTATMVSVRDGEVITTDGPFAETKEQLGGFYILECEDLDEAIHWAAQIPGAQHGRIEVRPVPNYG